MKKILLLVWFLVFCSVNAEAETLNVIPRILAGSDIEIEHLGAHKPSGDEGNTIVNNHIIKINDNNDSSNGLNWVTYVAKENSPFIREPDGISCMLDFKILPGGRRKNAMIILDNRTPVMGPPNDMNFSYRLSFLAGKNKIQFFQILEGEIVREWEMDYDIKVNEVYSLAINLADSGTMGCFFSIFKYASNPLSISWNTEMVATVFFDSIGFDAPWGAYFSVGVGTNKSSAEFRNADIKFSYFEEQGNIVVGLNGDTLSYPGFDGQFN